MVPVHYVELGSGKKNVQNKGDGIPINRGDSSSGCKHGSSTIVEANFVGKAKTQHAWLIFLAPQNLERCQTPE